MSAVNCWASRPLRAGSGISSEIRLTFFFILRGIGKNKTFRIAVTVSPVVRTNHFNYKLFEWPETSHTFAHTFRTLITHYSLHYLC